MQGSDWNSILEAVERLPSGIPTDHAAMMVRWFRSQFAGSTGPAPSLESPLPRDQAVPPAAAECFLHHLSFPAVRARMEALGPSRAVRGVDKALLCGWVWSVGGSNDFCSNDAQKLFGEDGARLNAHHFNRHAGEESGGSPPRLVRVGKGRYRFTECGREEGERLARIHLVERPATGGGRD